MTIYICPRNCYSCIFGFCDSCDGNGADWEEIEVWDMVRGLILAFGCPDPGPLTRSCRCAENGHPWHREDEPKELLAMSPQSAIVISSDLL